MTNRRKLLAAAGATVSVPLQAVPKLAIDGGEPVRQAALRADYWGTQFFDDKEKRELLDVLESRRPFRWYGPGKEPPMKVLTFEKEFASRMQTKYALAVPSGTAALVVAVNALGIGPGDEVIVPTMTFAASFTFTRGWSVR